MAKKIYLSPSNQVSNSYAYGNTNEMVQCNRIAEAARVALKRCGFDVKKAPQGQNMNTSINESNNWGADLHIPVHTNAGGGKGVEVFLHNTKAPNITVGNAVYRKLVEVAPSKTARYIGTYRYGGTLAEIANTNAICVYCECEFHDNKNYAKYIIENATKFGEAICKGVCEYYKVAYKAPSATTSKKKVLDSSGFKQGQSSDGILALKELLLISKALKIHPYGVDENGIFGGGTHKAVNGLLKKWGYSENGIAGDNFIKKLTAEIKKKI